MEYAVRWYLTNPNVFFPVKCVNHDLRQRMNTLVTRCTRKSCTTLPLSVCFACRVALRFFILVAFPSRTLVLAYRVSSCPSRAAPLSTHRCASDARRATTELLVPLQQKNTAHNPHVIRNAGTEPFYECYFTRIQLDNPGKSSPSATASTAAAAASPSFTAAFTFLAISSSC